MAVEPDDGPNFRPIGVHCKSSNRSNDTVRGA